MIELTEELINYMQRYKETFNDIVPLREIPTKVSTNELIELIKKSLEDGKDYLIENLGYTKIEKDKNVVV